MIPDDLVFSVLFPVHLSVSVQIILRLLTTYLCSHNYEFYRDKAILNTIIRYRLQYTMKHLTKCEITTSNKRRWK
jgi:hypothetical protein